MPRRPKRLRGHDLALHLEHTATFKGVARARTKQTYLSAQYKINHAISLNIYDAARSYRDTQPGLTSVPLRAILKDQRFRNAWGTFKGGHRWEYSTEKREWVKKYRKKGGITSTFSEKMAAATTLGWHSDQLEAIDKLRNISP
jgi:hypothetical protein